VKEERIYYNGDILTLEEELYTDAVLVRDGKIVKTGTLSEVEEKAGPQAEKINLEGKTMLPAFIDPHSHFSGYASSFMQADLKETVSFDEILEAIKHFIKKNQVPPGKWIQANGYDQNSLEEKTHPTLELLNQAAPNNPLLIKHASNHMGVFNSMALNELGITVDTKSPEGGRIEIKDGKLTGYMEEAAYMHYVQQIPMATQEEFMESLMKAQQSYISHGITTVQEGFVVKGLSPIYHGMMQQNMLKIDLIGYLDISEAEELKEEFKDCLKTYHSRIKMGGYKMFLDGSPQGRTAWMRTPYLGEEKDYRGYPVHTDEELKEKLSVAVKENMQILVHCNGDAACEQYITEYRNALQETGATHDIRPVIIHAQLLGTDQLERVKELHMIPSFFVAHVYYWGDVHIRNFGMERASAISPAKSAQKEGICYTFHQDSPVIEPDMLETIWCAVNRITRNGVLLGEQEKITPLEAIKAVTKNAAYQYFEEDLKGTIREGKLADLIILDRNPLKIDPMEIKNIQVVETIKEGKVIFTK